jgi:hypothetical protein
MPTASPPLSSRPKPGPSQPRPGAPASPALRLRRAWRALQASLWRLLLTEIEIGRPRTRAAARQAGGRGSRPRRAPLPPMPKGQVVAARGDLAAFLDRAPGARRVWPSLALLERVLASGAADGVHRVEACVLRHAARSLDRAGDDLCPGLVVLRRRIELVLRRKYGDPPSHWGRMPPAGAPDPARGFQDSLTEFIDVEHFAQAANGRR